MRYVLVGYFLPMCVLSVFMQPGMLGLYMKHLMSEICRVTHGPNSKNTSARQIKSDRLRYNSSSAQRNTLLPGKEKSTELF